MRYCLIDRLKRGNIKGKEETMCTNEGLQRKRDFSKPLAHPLTPSPSASNQWNFNQIGLMLGPQLGCLHIKKGLCTLKGQPLCIAFSFLI